MRTFFRTILLTAALMSGFSFSAVAQTANGRATTAPPVYTNNSAAPLSLDTAGNLRVNCITGCAGGGSGGAVDITAVGGNVVTTTVPISGSVTTSGTATVSGTVAVSTVGAGTANIGDVDVLTLPSVTIGTNAALVAGTANIGDVDVLTMPTVTANATVIPATTTAGTSSLSAILAATTNATSVKASAGTLFEISVYNSSATVAWLKFYNSASAPTCGSGTPVARYLIPGAASGGAGSNINVSLGKSFATGIAYCVTGLLADADATATAAGTMSVNLTYK